ncbi:Histidinol-phosphate aminotransferase [subsurface metagenome]
MELRELLQEYTGVGAGYIVASAGSDQLIDLILRLFVEPGDEVINCVPSFAMFPFFIELCRGTHVEVPRDEDFAVNVKAVKAAITKKTKMILLATPNNPTADVHCYLSQSIIHRHGSKWAGLAGLRIGYGMFPPQIADYLLRIKEPYCVNMAAQVAVRESLKDIDYLKGRVKAIIAERERLFGALQKLEWLKPFPSKANFILCLVKKGKASEVQKKLQNKGILVRYFDKPLLRDCIRISVGKPEHTTALVKVLQELGKEMNGE